MERALLALFVPIWLVCFALSAHDAVVQTGYPSLLVSAPAGPDGYPEVVAFVPGIRGESSGIRVGDRLHSVGGIDLRGKGHFSLYTPFARERAPEGALSAVFERDREIRATTLAVGSYRIYWPRLLASVVFAAVAALLLLRAPPGPMVRAFAGTYMCVALLLACTFAGDELETSASIAVHVVSLSLACPLSVRGALLFPAGVPPTRWIARYGPWVFAAFGPLDASRFYQFPLSREVGTLASTGLAVVYFPLVLGIVTDAYRRADPLGRRQLRWFLYGLYLAFALPIAATAIAALDARFVPMLVVSMASFALVPIFLVISITRYNLFDIDRLVSATASLTVLGIGLFTVLLVAVPRVVRAVSEPAGIDPELAQLALSVLLAVILVPGYGWLRPRMDRVFHPDRWVLEQEIEKLLDDLSRCDSPQEVTRLSGERIDALLRPASCVIYSRGDSSFYPVFVRGRAIPPAFESASPLIAVLTRRPVPLGLEKFAQPRPGFELSPFDRAALETLGSPVVVPVRRGHELVAFQCLGPKLSGDVYTSTELAFLAAIADKVSGELSRFDQREMIRQARAMGAALRRYVPGALAERLEHGGDVEPGEREVTVLFVDIRGYTAFAEGRGAAEIFSSVNRYTEAVSEIVRKHGGSVVEFNGDGMMAVFGAPEELGDKERCATAAGRDIVAGVTAIALTAPDVGSPPLEAGVGIATGPAFVGNVRAVDRLIWTAIGNTTNLAARLQELTRELDAAIVIDETTWKHARDLGHAFQKRPNTRIRGRTRTEDLYVLPIRRVESRLRTVTR